MKQKSKTYTVKQDDLTPQWQFVDADGKILGKVAADIAKLLLGKHKPIYSTHANVGDKVVVTNAGKIAVTGNKLRSKIYYWHTGYPGGIRDETLDKLMARKPTEALRRAVKGMLPKNKLINERMKNLYIYEGTEHPHQGQANAKKESK